MNVRVRPKCVLEGLGKPTIKSSDFRMLPNALATLSRLLRQLLNKRIYSR
jgi:hypothetical protein